MPIKRKPTPVFVARSNDFGKVNYAVTADGVVYILEMRGSYLAGADKLPEEKYRRMHNQEGAMANRWRARLTIDKDNPQA